MLQGWPTKSPPLILLPYNDSQTRKSINGSESLHYRDWFWKLGAWWHWDQPCEVQHFQDQCHPYQRASQGIEEHLKVFPPSVASPFLSIPVAPSAPLLSTEISLTAPQLPPPEPWGGSLGCETDPNPSPWQTPPFSSWEGQGSRSLPHNSFFNIKSSTSVTRWVISYFLLSRRMVTWCTKPWDSFSCWVEVAPCMDASTNWIVVIGI